MFSCKGIRNSMRQCIMWWLIVFIVSCWYAEVSASDIQVAYDFETSRVITLKKKFNITCILVDAPLAHIKWFHNEKEVVVKENVISIVEKSPEFQLIIEKPTDADTGNYSCQAYQNKTLLKSKDILVVSLPTASLDADSIVVEDEKLTLDCHPTGRPIPEVKWLVRGDYVLNGTGNTSRITGLPSNNIPNGKLRISSAMMSDRGEYKCIVSNIVNTNMNISEAVAVTVVRVKDKLAALWPFLGICAEVFVLCAIILIYEKKRNKAELDESDTDNSPEQKNTPDHGKDSVRQRK